MLWAKRVVVDSKGHGAHKERLPLLASEGTNRNEGHEMIMHIRHEGERLCLLIQHLLELLEAQDAVAVLVELGEDGLDLVLVELLGHLGELVLGDVDIRALAERPPVLLKSSPMFAASPPARAFGAHPACSAGTTLPHN